MQWKKSKKKPIYSQCAEYFLNEYELNPKKYLDTIKSIKRENPYKQNSHNGHHYQTEEMVPEKVEALALFNSIKGKNYPFEIIDYEVPLKAKSEDEGIGEIDLIGKKDKTVYLLELKKFNNPNGALLHMILQSYTYFKLLNINKFKEEYTCTKVVPAIIFFENSVNHLQYLDSKNIIFHELVKQLEMEVFVVKCENGFYKNENDIFEINQEKPLLKGKVKIEKL